MASAFPTAELSSLLGKPNTAGGADQHDGAEGSRGGGRSPKPPTRYGQQQAAALSQLSDLAKDLASKAAPVAQFGGSQPPFSQESLVVAPLTFQPPSQPDIPAPALPDSQGTQGQVTELVSNADKSAAAAAAAAAAAQRVVAPAAAALLPFTAADFMAHQPMMLATAEFMAHPGAFAFAGTEDMQQHLPREKGSKPTRRGPMDEMRQLVRILVKILPHSIAFIGSGEEAGGGNRISEEQIKVYLERTLGQAPRPTWGVPGGWYQYVAQLFSWATGTTVSEEDAKRCAKREPGRSWEALESEMSALGVHPSSWPLPLTLEGVQVAEKNPVPLPVPQIIAKRSTDESGQPVSKRQKGGGGGGLPDLDKLGELELWGHLLAVMNECQNKQGKGSDQTAVMALKIEAKQRFELLTGNSPMNMFQGLQYVPVAMGLDGGQSVMALLGGMQGGMMLPQVPGAQFGLPGGQPGDVPIGLDQAEQANMAIQAAAANMAIQAVAAQAMQAQAQAGLAQALPAAAAPAAGEGERGRKRDREEGGEQGAQSEGEGMARPSADAAAAAVAAAARLAPLSGQEARGALFGALGGASGSGEGA